MNYTVADSSRAAMCGIDYGMSIPGVESTINVESNEYLCGHFRFAIRNVFGASGIAFYAVVQNISFAATAHDSPPLPHGVHPLRAYAAWVLSLIHI